MEKLTITLKVGKGYKKYEAPKNVSTETLQMTFELEADMDKGLDSAKIITKSLTLICSIFGNQFTTKDLSRGITYHEIIPFTSKAMDHVIELMGISGRLKEPYNVLRGGKVVHIGDSRKNRT